jgi:hypothetical protein
MAHGWKIDWFVRVTHDVVAVYEDPHINQVPISLYEDAPAPNVVINIDAAILCPSTSKPKTIACLATRFRCVGIYGHVQISVVNVRTCTIETNLRQ